MYKVNKYNIDEFISYLEDKISIGIATEEEMILYEDYKWFGKMDVNSTHYKKAIKAMIKDYNEKW